MKLNSERLLTHLKNSGQRVNKISGALEIVLIYSDYLLQLPLNALLEGINMKFECLLHNLDNIQHGVNVRKTESKTPATTIPHQPTGKGLIQLLQAVWAQVAVMVTPPLSLRVNNVHFRFVMEHPWDDLPRALPRL